MKAFDEYTLDDLVDHCAGQIVKDLLNGCFRTGVYQSLMLALAWRAEQDKQEAQKAKAKGERS